ncbi:hypothetical protein E2C01_032650 [Portunus trituberculatus]|uniref:Secreted protein n=1 Tax=Portunus trituberculatus TaxID=210409 RepID=A0A5B7EVT9_PORTR|nr:hypothetical protein [Portunus trituberculatus]
MMVVVLVLQLCLACSVSCFLCVQRRGLLCRGGALSSAPHGNLSLAGIVKVLPRVLGKHTHTLASLDNYRFERLVKKDEMSEKLQVITGEKMSSCDWRDSQCKDEIPTVRVS